jgi:hypothetical protein
LNKEKGLQGVSFLFLIQIEERIGDPVRMLPKTRLEVTHLTKACTLKLAHRETLKKEDRTNLISKKQLAKVQEEKREGLLIAKSVTGYPVINRVSKFI